VMATRATLIGVQMWTVENISDWGPTPGILFEGNTLVEAMTFIDKHGGMTCNSAKVTAPDGSYALFPWWWLPYDLTPSTVDWNTEVQQTQELEYMMSLNLKEASKYLNNRRR